MFIEKFDNQDTKIIKGVAICLMLYHHLFTDSSRLLENVYYIAFIELLGKNSAQVLGMFGKVCVSIFLLLGGYGAFILCNKQGGFLVLAKLRKLYQSFWKVFVWVVPMSMILGLISFDFFEMIGNITAVSLTYNAEWWFLSPYLLLTVSTPILYQLANRLNLINSCIVVVLLTVLFYVGIPILNEVGCVYSFMQTILGRLLYYYVLCIPFYYEGLLVAKYKMFDRIVRRVGKLKKWESLIISMAIFLFIFVARFFFGEKLDILFGLSFCIGTIFARPFFYSSNMLTNVFLFLGKHSTNIWLIHTFVCYKWFQRQLFSVRYSVCIFGLLLVVCLVLSIVQEKIYGTIAATVAATVQRK